MGEARRGSAVRHSHSDVESGRARVHRGRAGALLQDRTMKDDPSSAATQVARVDLRTMASHFRNSCEGHKHVFRTAYQIARQFTWPVIVSVQNRKHQCAAAIATLTIINKDGWFATAHH